MMEGSVLKGVEEFNGIFGVLFPVFAIPADGCVTVFVNKSRDGAMEVMVRM